MGAQRGWLSTNSLLYLTLNLAGAAILAVLAAHERQLGFLLLEFCWAVVAAYSLMRTLRNSQGQERHDNRAEWGLHMARMRSISHGRRPPIGAILPV